MTYQSQYYNPEYDRGSVVEHMVGRRRNQLDHALAKLGAVTPVELPTPEVTPVTVVPTAVEAEVANLAQRRYVTEEQAHLEQIRLDIKNQYPPQYSTEIAA